MQQQTMQPRLNRHLQAQKSFLTVITKESGSTKKPSDS
jgi:hypothetical protein